MKKLIAILAIVVAWGSIASSAQVILNNTTLSAAATSSATTVTVASATGITAPLTSDPTKATFLVVDAELMQVISVNTTIIGVARGVGGTQGRPHASSAVVFVVPAFDGTYFTSIPPTGSCTRANVIALPVITLNPPTAAIYSDCLGGQWVNGDALQSTRATFYRFEAPTIGAVANTSALGTSTATVAAELYCTEIKMPYSRLVTGLAPHIGATGGTDKWIVALYDSGGNLVANSAVAGATVGSANAWQATAFTVPYYVVGPGQYFGCLMSNGTTATADLIKTGTDDNVLTFKSASAGTFGTLPNFTAPTSFTTVNGPFLYVY